MARYIFRFPAWLGWSLPCLLALTAPVWAASRLCDDAAHRAARRHDLPAEVLLAITRVETGRGQAATPWPWTVNMEGAGHWFDTENQAQVFVFRHFKGGARSFDVGCFQINYKWHGRAFRSIEEMFDPDHSADYAAQFLKDLYADLGDWSAAAGAYHSRTPSLSRRYAARFDRILADLDRAPTQAIGPRPLTGAGPARMGSLVSVAVSNAKPLFQID